MNYYVFSNDEHQWVGRAKRGFTPAVIDAGVFSYADAIEMCRTANKSGPKAAPNLVIVPVKEMREAYGAKFAADPLRPAPALLAKLGSIIVHAEEAASPGGHPFDAEAIKALMDDAEVREWLQGMAKLAMLPVKR